MEFFDWCSILSPQEYYRGGRRQNLCKKFDTLISDQFTIIVLSANAKSFAAERRWPPPISASRLLFLNDPNEQRLKTLLVCILTLKLTKVLRKNRQWEFAISESTETKLGKRIDESKQAIQKKLKFSPEIEPIFREEIFNLIDRIHFDDVRILDENGWEMPEVAVEIVEESVKKLTAKNTAQRKMELINEETKCDEGNEEPKNEEIQTEVEPKNVDLKNDNAINDENENNVTDQAFINGSSDRYHYALMKIGSGVSLREGSGRSGNWKLSQNNFQSVYKFTNKNHTKNGSLKSIFGSKGRNTCERFLYRGIFCGEMEKGKNIYKG